MMVSKDDVLDKLRHVFDPEMPASLVDLGLVYDVNVTDGVVEIRMTFTSRDSPLIESTISEVKEKVAELSGVSRVDVELVWDPRWTPDRMSEEARRALGVE